MPVIINAARRCVTRSTANETFYANSAQLDANTEPTITGYAIQRVEWAGQVAVARGANTVLTFPASTAGTWELEGAELYENYAASVAVSITGTGTCILHLEKMYT